jgi:molybdenum cofactor cytidylyltransferase
MSDRKIAGIILAAGGSKRLGRPKQLLDWFGKTFIQQVVDIALDADLEPIIVVTGANFREVESSIKDRKVIIARNDRWKEGQSSSLITGIKELGINNQSPFVFLLCDQPQVSAKIVINIIQASKDDEKDIVTASVNGKRCPPILFKPNCIVDLLLLTGDQGGRGLMSKYRTAVVEIDDDRIILDSDTDADYLKLINSYKL